MALVPWRGGRAVECAGLENRYGRFVHRGFESPPLRLIGANLPMSDQFGYGRVDGRDRSPPYQPLGTTPAGRRAAGPARRRLVAWASVCGLFAVIGPLGNSPASARGSVAVRAVLSRTVRSPGRERVLRRHPGRPPAARSSRVRRSSCATRAQCGTSACAASTPRRLERVANGVPSAPRRNRPLRATPWRAQAAREEPSGNRASTASSARSQSEPAKSDRSLTRPRMRGDHSAAATSAPIAAPPSTSLG